MYTERPVSNSRFASYFLTGFALAFIVFAAWAFLEGLSEFLGVAGSKPRASAMLYQVGWIIAICLPPAVFAGASFAASRVLLLRSRPRSLLRAVCYVGILTSLVCYVHNDRILPETNHRLKVNLLEARRAGTEIGEESPAPSESYLRGAREMTISMLYDKLESYTDTYAPQETRERLKRTLEVEIQKRYSLSFSPFAFAIAGLALGGVLRRQNPWLVLVISAAAFPLFLFMVTVINMLAGRGYVSPVAVWFPEALFLAAGGIMLLWRRTRD